MLRKTIAAAVLCIAPAALAQNNRSAVSVTGLDSNPCTTTSPCRSFSVAFAATAADGEIIALTSGGYGPFTITGPITVSGIPGMHAAITTTGDGILVSTAFAANIVIRNLTIIGPPSTMGSSNGVRVDTPSKVRVMNCVIRGFPGSGVQAFDGFVSVDHCMLLDNEQGAGAINNLAPSRVTYLTITHSLIQGNNAGVAIGTGSEVTVSHSTISLGQDGIDLAPIATPSSSALVVIESCQIVNNTSNGIGLFPQNGNAAFAYISDTLFENDNIPIQNNSGAVFTFSNNEFAHNSVGPGPMNLLAMR